MPEQGKLMQTTICHACRGTFPTNETFRVLDRVLCDKCSETEITQANKKKLPAGSIARQSDPTVCFACKHDNGSYPLATLGGNLPVCPACESKFRNPVFPNWLTGAAVVVVALAVISILYHWRFFEAFFEIRKGAQALAAQDFDKASAHFTAASLRVPESNQTAALAGLYRGALLMRDDKATEALPHLRKALLLDPENSVIQDAILKAEIGQAFDNKDYDRFVDRAKAGMERFPKDPLHVATLASAYACKWAETGNAVYKKDALKYLDQARQLAGTEDPRFKEFEARITFRLDSREIISKQEYDKRFPSGYKRPGGAS
ncbi:MAG TPA: hypothetical protein VGH16_23185 [Candidatus Binatia bacterium]|jgi:tetratricopeptide (TPR) repeat protein